MTQVAQKSGSVKEDVAQKAPSSKEDVAQKAPSSKEDVAQKAHSFKEIVAKHRVAVISAIVVVALIAAGGAYMLLKPHTSSVGTAQEQSSQQSPIEAVKSLIDRLRGRDMPEGISKTNGRIEATEVDVAAKYPGRLATETVDEGDEVTAGQVVATISSPETEAQLRNAQAQLLKSKQDLAAAVATVAQRKSDVDFTSADYDRGKKLITEGWITQQLLDLRRNKFELAQAAYDAADKDREGAEASIKAAEADVERLQSILNDLVLLSPRTGRVQYRLARAGEVVAAGQRVSDHPRSQRRLHDHLPARGCGGTAYARRRGAHHSRSDPRICTAQHHQLRGDRGAVHAEERRDRRGTGEADVPR